MTAGPGKYDDLCTYVRQQSNAEITIVLVINGKHGTGFSVQAVEDVGHLLPELLESMAKDIRSDMRDSVTT